MKTKILTIIICVFAVLNSNAQNCNLICNGNFETPYLPGGISLIDSNVLSCWHTTAPDGIMEIWTGGYQGVQPYSGNQFLEINANCYATVYQNLVLKPGSQINISFAHRGRLGIDTMEVSIGEVGGLFTSLGYFADNNYAWGAYNIGYSVPPVINSNVFELRFTTIYASSSYTSVGNFIDDIEVCYDQVGINDLSDYISKFYFNSNSKTLNIELKNHSAAQLYIYNSLGEEIKKASLLDNFTSIELSRLPGGVYAAILNLNGLKKEKKFVITD